MSNSKFFTFTKWFYRAIFFVFIPFYMLLAWSRSELVWVYLAFTFSLLGGALKRGNAQYKANQIELDRLNKTDNLEITRE